MMHPFSLKDVWCKKKQSFERRIFRSILKRGLLIFFISTQEEEERYRDGRPIFSNNTK